jgi:phage gp36-like protein
MPYLLPGDLNTHIYEENRDEIAREDNSVVQTCIDAAIAEVKSYLSRFDLLKIFGDGDTVEPTHADENLKNKVKDVATWHLVCLANPNIQMEVARTRYEDAIKWLTMVQSGKADPKLPMPVDDEDTDFDESTNIQWNSNPKRNNHY